MQNCVNWIEYQSKTKTFDEIKIIMVNQNEIK